MKWVDLGVNGERRKRGKKENNLAAVRDQPGTCRKERKRMKRKRRKSLGERCNFGSCTRRPLGKSLQPTEALQAHKSPEKAQAARDPEVTLPSSLPSPFFSCSPFLHLSVPDGTKGRRPPFTTQEHLQLDAFSSSFVSKEQTPVAS